MVLVGPCIVLVCVLPRRWIQTQIDCILNVYQPVPACNPLWSRVSLHARPPHPSVWFVLARTIVVTPHENQYFYQLQLFNVTTHRGGLVSGRELVRKEAKGAKGGGFRQADKAKRNEHIRSIRFVCKLVIHGCEAESTCVQVDRGQEKINAAETQEAPKPSQLLVRKPLLLSPPPLSP